jgi:hypothetical protein
MSKPGGQRSVKMWRKEKCWPAPREQGACASLFEPTSRLRNEATEVIVTLQSLKTWSLIMCSSAQSTQQRNLTRRCPTFGDVLYNHSMLKLARIFQLVVELDGTGALLCDLTLCS